MVKYYAEFDTDKIIRETYFSDFSKIGTMVEVGAATPEFLSMSKHFRESGWRCICIEPNPKFVQMHKDNGYEIHQYACSYEDKDNVDFQIIHLSDDYASKITDHSLSSFHMKDSYVKLHTYLNFDKLNIINIKVKQRKLDTVLTELNVPNIDFLSIDTEGWELEVMKGFDAKQYKPKVVLLENLTKGSEYTEYMNKIGYKLDKAIKYNYIYSKV